MKYYFVQVGGQWTIACHYVGPLAPPHRGNQDIWEILGFYGLAAPDVVGAEIAMPED